MYVAIIESNIQREKPHQFISESNRKTNRGRSNQTRRTNRDIRYQKRENHPKREKNTNKGSLKMNHHTNREKQPKIQNCLQWEIFTNTLWALYWLTKLSKWWFDNSINYNTFSYILFNKVIFLFKSYLNFTKFSFILNKSVNKRDIWNNGANMW